MRIAPFAVFATLAVALAPLAAFADDQVALNECIAAWGAKSPFRKGAHADKVVTGGVHVFGIGKGNAGGDAPTDRPSLIMVRPAVNVLGKTTLRLGNPNGWYCFRSNVTVMGKMTVEAHCSAHLASAKGEGTSVMAADESDKGVAVMGALRIERFDCPAGKGK